MKRIYIVAFLMLLCTTADAQIMAKLKEIGMENIRCVQTPETTTVAFENNVYRGTYTGIGKAVTACLDGIPGGLDDFLDLRLVRLFGGDELGLVRGVVGNGVLGGEGFGERLIDVLF